MAFAVQRNLDTFLDVITNNLTIFGPIMVFSGTVILFTASITTVVAIIICYALTAKVSLDLSQSFMLASSIVSFVFAGLYLLAARRNEPIGKPRPPILPLHSACVVFARLAIFHWVVAATITLITIARGVECSSVDQTCMMQRLNMAMSILAILAAVSTSCGLENCDEPFRTPKILNIRPKLMCRVSYFDDILERSVSCSSSMEEIETTPVQKSSQPVDVQLEQIKRKQLQEHMARLSWNQSQALPALIGPVNLDKSVWHSGWSGLENKSDGSSKSSISSHSGDTASIYTALTEPICESMHSQRSLPSSDVPSETPQGLNPPYTSKKEVAAPSSSIGSTFHRSPLSTMRTIDNPSVAIQPVLRFFPRPQIRSAQGPNFLPHHDGNGANVATLTTVHIKSVHGDSSAMVRPLEIKKQGIAPRSCENYPRKLYRVPLKAASYPKPQLIDRCRSYNRYNAVGRHEDSLEAHTRDIEEAILAAHRLREHHA